MKQPIGTGIIVIKEDKVLLGKRKNAYAAGSYGLPGGRVELGESLAETAKRELEEETGLIAQALDYVGVVREFQETKDFIHFIFVCTKCKGEPTVLEPDKCEAWGWFALDKLETLQLLDGHKAAIELWQDKKRLVDISL